MKMKTKKPKKNKKKDTLLFILGYLIIFPGLLGLILFPIIAISYTFNLGLHFQNPNLRTYIFTIWMGISTIILYIILLTKAIKKYNKENENKKT